jgi:phosphoketolase
MGDQPTLISDVIKHLGGLLEQHGDIEVWFSGDGYTNQITLLNFMYVGCYNELPWKPKDGRRKKILIIDGAE